MKLNLYVLKNRLSGIYEKPICELADSKEYAEMLTQSLALAPVDALNLHKEYDIYFVGSYESKSGVITSCDPEFVMSLESICLNYLAAKEVKENVGSTKREESASV